MCVEGIEYYYILYSSAPFLVHYFLRGEGFLWAFFNRIIDKMVSDKVPFKKRKRLIVFVAIITLLSMTTATVAWFSVNTFAGVDKLDLNISLAAQT